MNKNVLLALLPFIIAGCGGGGGGDDSGGDNSSTTAPTPITAPTAASDNITINGIWKSQCESVTESNTSDYLVETLEFANGYFEKTLDYYSDEECNTYTSSDSVVGDYFIDYAKSVRLEHHINWTVNELTISIVTPEVSTKTYYADITASGMSFFILVKESAAYKQVVTAAYTLQ